jgi:hypothetical protein
MKMISAESGTLSEFIECWFFFRRLDDAAAIGDLRRVLLFERRLIRPAAFARPKAAASASALVSWKRTFTRLAKRDGHDGRQ